MVDRNGFILVADYLNSRVDTTGQAVELRQSIGSAIGGFEWLIVSRRASMKIKHVYIQRIIRINDYWCIIFETLFLNLQYGRYIAHTSPARITYYVPKKLANMGCRYCVC